MTRFLFQPPADCERGPKYLEGLIAGWSTMVGRESFTLGFTSRAGNASFVIDVPGDRQRLIVSQLVNAFPGSSAEVLPETDRRLKHRVVRYLRLSPDVIPLVLHEQFVEVHSREAVDPIEGLLEAVKCGRSGHLNVDVSLRIRPASPRKVDQAQRRAPYVFGRSRLRFVQRAYCRLCTGRRRQRFAAWLLSRFIRKGSPDVASVEKLNQHLLTVELVVTVSCDSQSPVLRRKLDDVVSALTQFTQRDVVFFVEKKRVSFLLTASEVSTLFHPPISSVSVPRVDRSLFRELEPPTLLASRKGNSDAVTLGRVCFRNERQRFGLELEARRRHLYVLGKTGMGKTTLLQNILAEDIAARRGVAVIEPHGDLAESVLNMIPKHRTNDLVLFDPADTAFPIAFNPLRVPAGGDSTVVADGVLSAFQKVFGMDESQAPRLLHIFRNCLLSLVEMPDATLLSVQRLLIDDVYRKSVVAHVRNPVVRSFWLDEFGKWKPHDRTVFIASLQNKLGAFLTNDKLQNI
ncbi:DUF87 domain-containing protein, partial [bacterium]|nr:DUF87 domain-containing protein [bacterium]